MEVEWSGVSGGASEWNGCDGKKTGGCRGVHATLAHTHTLGGGWVGVIREEGRERGGQGKKKGSALAAPAPPHRERKKKRKKKGRKRQHLFLRTPASRVLVACPPPAVSPGRGLPALVRRFAVCEATEVRGAEGGTNG